MSIRILLSAAGAVAALATASASALHAQSTQDTTRRPPWIVNRGEGTSTPTNPAQTPTSGRAAVFADSGFIREALNGNLLEIRLGTVARSKASNGAVKDFAQRMVTEHTSMWNQWVALAKKNGQSTSISPEATGQATANHLATLSGAEFDQAYMSEMVRDHQADVAEFQQRGLNADAPEVRQLAGNAVSVMQQHLSLAQQVASQVGATTVATSPQANPTAPQLPAPGGQARPQSPGNGQVNPSGDRGAGDRDLAAADRKYVTEVAVGHLMEVRLAEMAQQKARDPEVKRFADRLHEDFDKWMSRWSELAGNNPHMGPLHREKVERLEKASRRQFDRTYLDIVTENLGSMVPYFQKEGRASTSARVRNMVKDELPTLQQHLQVAQRLDRQSRAGKSSGKDKDRSLSSYK